MWIPISRGINHALLYPSCYNRCVVTARDVVLYLSPAIERHSLGFAVAVVAMRTAYISQSRGAGISQEQYEAEAESWQTVKEWGFEKEKKSALTIDSARDLARRQKRFIACESGLIPGGALNG
jgi:hypothetical protein